MTQGKFCNDELKAKCEQEHDPAHLEWACAHCPNIRGWQMHPYTAKLLNMRLLVSSGFPMDAGMLTYEEWLDLGRINLCLTPPPLKLP